MTDKIILGIDPGTSIMGYGLIKVNGNSMSLLALGILDLHKLSNHYIKLKKIFDRTLMLIDEFHPDELAIEAPFYGENVQSMLKLGRAQGAAIAASLNRDIPIFEYAPRKIKMAITGQGTASKIQVAKVLEVMLKIEQMPTKLDATDGLAVAVCHYLQPQWQDEVQTHTHNWATYIKENADRVKK